MLVKNQEQKPKLSICIPTYNRNRQLKVALNSLISQARFQNTNDIEIIVSDNNSDDETEEAVKSYLDAYDGKIFYYKNPSNIEDLNFEKALSYGRGDFLKLINDSAVWLPGSLDYICGLIELAGNIQIPLFFANGVLPVDEKIVETNGLGEFVDLVSYNMTWIGAFGIWRKKFEILNNFSRESESRLTQVDVWLRVVKDAAHCVVTNEKCFEIQEVGRKGGYSVAQVFGQNYLRILRSHIDDIGETVYAKEKKDVLLKHIVKYQMADNHDFKLEPFEEYLHEYMGEPYFHQAVVQVNEHKRGLTSINENDYLVYLQNLWREKNAHNHTEITKLCNISVISVGNYSYGPLEVWTWGNAAERMDVGHFVSIAENVKFLLGGNHDYKNISTYPFKVKFMGADVEATTKGPVVIGDDVWIGNSAIILSGVTIGQGAVIGAGCVLAKSVPPYAIMIGNPARIIGYRFPENVITKLLKIDYSKVDAAILERAQEILYEAVDENNIDQWMQYFPTKGG